jgi:hypothetical protein
VERRFECVQLGSQLLESEEQAMQKIGTLVAALAVGVVLAAPARAQQGRGGFGMFGGGGYALVGNKSVQQELKLSDEQTQKATKLAEDLRAKAREKMEGLSQEEQRGEKGREIRQALNEEAKGSVKDILKTDQLVRLDQIILQQRGLQAFADAKVQEKVSLSDDQKTKIKEIAGDIQTRQRELRQEFANDRQGAMQKMMALRKEGMDKALGVLTDSQKKSWKELTGEPFEVKFEQRRPNAA